MKTTRLHKAIAAVVLAALIAPASVVARPGKGPDIDRIAEQLGLSTEQRSQVETIFKEQREKHAALRDETHARLEQVLTEEQQVQFEQMRNARRGKGRGRGQRDGKTDVQQ